MNKLAHTSHEKSSRTRDDFLARFMKNLAKEIVLTARVIRSTFGIIFALLLGIVLFLSEFDLIKKFFAFALFPAVIFLIGTYLTLLPMYLVIAITCVSFYSLTTSDEGSSLVKWFSHLFSSLSEGLGEPSNSKVSLSKKLFGFVALSAIASFFIVFLV